MSARQMSPDEGVQNLEGEALRVTGTAPLPSENLQELCAQIHGRRLRQTQAGCPIHRAQSKARPLHHRLPLYYQLTLI
jgi:hypothetical protein